MSKKKLFPRPEPNLEPRVVLYMQDHSGDNNLERSYFSRETAMAAFDQIRTYGGYWTNNGNIFVPWHRINFVRIEDELEGGARG